MYMYYLHVCTRTVHKIFGSKLFIRKKNCFLSQARVRTRNLWPDMQQPNHLSYRGIEVDKINELTKITMNKIKLCIFLLHVLLPLQAIMDSL